MSIRDQENSNKRRKRKISIINKKKEKEEKELSELPELPKLSHYVSRDIEDEILYGEKNTVIEIKLFQLEKHTSALVQTIEKIKNDIIETKKIALKIPILEERITGIRNEIVTMQTGIQNQIKGVQNEIKTRHSSIKTTISIVGIALTMVIGFLGFLKIL